MRLPTFWYCLSDAIPIRLPFCTFVCVQNVWPMKVLTSQLVVTFAWENWSCVSFQNVRYVWPGGLGCLGNAGGWVDIRLKGQAIQHQRQFVNGSSRTRLEESMREWSRRTENRKTSESERASKMRRLWRDPCCFSLFINDLPTLWCHLNAMFADKMYRRNSSPAACSLLQTKLTNVCK